MHVPDNFHELVGDPVAWGTFIRSLNLADAAVVLTLVQALQSGEGSDDADWRLAELVHAIAEAGGWVHATTVSRSIRGFLARADALRSTAVALGRSGDTSGATGLLMEAAMVAQAGSIECERPDPIFLGSEWVGWSSASAWQKALALARIAQALWSFGEADQARRVWTDATAIARLGEESTSRQDNVDSSSVLWEIAEGLAVAGEFAAATAVAQAIQTEGLRDKALSGVDTISRGGQSSFARFW